MQLPFTTHLQSAQLAEKLRNGEVFDKAEFIEWRDLEVEKIQLQSICNGSRILVEEQRDAVEIELLLSKDIFLELKSLPTYAREDYDFWRGITLAFFYDLAIYRTETSPKAKDPAKRKWEILGAGSNAREILAWRMFVRGRVSAVQNPDGSFEFPNMLETGKKSHDFWMSHLLGTRTGTEHALARGVIKLQAQPEEYLPTAKLRPFVRDLVNRPKRTLAMHLMTDDEVDAYLRQEKVKVDLQMEDSGDE